MTARRVEAFSDGVIAIIITIMVLEMKVPHGADWTTLYPLIPVFISYVISFVYLGIYWNNHHHMLAMSEHVGGGVLWANLHLLFWLSLIPFTTGWMGENHFAPTPVFLYGVVLLMAAIAYFMLQSAVIRKDGAHSRLRKAIGRDIKGKISPVCYLAAIVLTYVHPWISVALYLLVALMWLVPDRRIESAVRRAED